MTGPSIQWPLSIELFSAKDIEDACKAAKERPAWDAAEALHWANFAAQCFLLQPIHAPISQTKKWYQTAHLKAEAFLAALQLNVSPNREHEINLGEYLATQLAPQDELIPALLRVTLLKPNVVWPPPGLGLAHSPDAVLGMNVALAGVKLLSLALKRAGNRKRGSGPKPKPASLLIKYLAISFEAATGRKLSVTVTVDFVEWDGGKPAGKAFEFISRMIEIMSKKLFARIFRQRVLKHVSEAELKNKIRELSRIGSNQIGAGLQVQRRKRTRLQNTIQINCRT